MSFGLRGRELDERGERLSGSWLGPRGTGWIGLESNLKEFWGFWLWSSPVVYSSVFLSSVVCDVISGGGEELGEEVGPGVAYLKVICWFDAGSWRDG